MSEQLPLPEAGSRYFYELTPERVLQSVERWNVRCSGRVLTLNSMENRVYEIELVPERDDQKPDSIIAKFYRPGRWSAEQIGEEHQFLKDLQEYEIPAVAPTPLPNGETLLHLEEIDIWCALFRKARGRSPQELSKEELARMGRLVARMHNVGATRTAEHRVKLSVETYGHASLDFLLASQLIDSEIEDWYADTAEEIFDLAEPLFKNISYQRIHGDCHLGNILWGSEGPFLVDFDDMVQGPCVQDLWLMLASDLIDSTEQQEILLGAYEEMRNFDRNELRLIEPLRALRMIHYAAWIGRRWKDPAFTRAFEHFGTPRYWREQTEDLTRQLELIREL